MPIFLLIRHGENDYVKKGMLAGRLAGVHLNAKGREQAQRLADMLTGAPVKAIYSSPLERTLETAQPIAQAVGLEIISRPGLIEVDFGEWQDQKLRTLGKLKLWKMVQNAPAVMRFPGGESFFEAQLRITADLLELANQYEAKDLVICVSHSDPIRLAAAYFLGLPLDLFQRLSVSPGSITTLTLSEMGGRVLNINCQPDFRFGEI
jgi:probable phosphomutase (TIGR03848 family)